MHTAAEDVEVWTVSATAAVVHRELSEKCLHSTTYGRYAYYGGFFKKKSLTVIVLSFGNEAVCRT